MPTMNSIFMSIFICITIIFISTLISLGFHKFEDISRGLDLNRGKASAVRINIEQKDKR